MGDSGESLSNQNAQSALDGSLNLDLVSHLNSTLALLCSSVLIQRLFEIKGYRLMWGILNRLFEVKDISIQRVTSR